MANNVQFFVDIFVKDDVFDLMTCNNFAFQLQLRIVYEVKMCKNMQGGKDEYQLLVGLVQLHRIDSDVLSKLFFNGSGQEHPMSASLDDKQTYRGFSFPQIHCIGIIKLPNYWGIKDCKCVGVLRDFPLIVPYCLGW